MALSEDIEAYAAYLNALPAAREQMRHEDLVEFEQDVEKARAAMEVAWLEQKPIKGR